MSTRNWKNFKWPYEQMSRFTRSEPFPSDAIKDTYITGMGKPRKKDTKMMYNAMQKRWVRKRPS